MEDYWRPINDDLYKDRYLVSRTGQIWSIIRQIEMKTCTRQGYPAISLYDKNDEKTTFSIHRLVAMAFIPTDDYSLIVNHKNGIKEDNNVENLEWVTQKENVQHALETGLKIPHTKKVSQYTLDGIKIATFDSIKEAAIQTGSSKGHIPSVCRGERITCGGYVWEYEDKENMIEEFTGTGLQYPLFPNYIIKSNGQIYSIIARRYLRPKLTESKYHIIGMCNDKEQKEFSVHRLVAELYIPNPLNKPIVNHKDMNKTNNDVTNLEWVTDSENLTHAIINSGFNHKKGVSQYTINSIFVKSYESIKQACHETGIDDSSIVKCCKGKIRSAGNFIWIYTDLKEYELPMNPYDEMIVNKNMSKSVSIAKSENKFQPETISGNGKAKTISQYTKDGVFIKSYESMADAERQTGISDKGISKCCSGKQKTSGGYVWKFINQN